MDPIYLEKETLVVDGEESVATVMGLLVEGTWLKEEVGKVDEEEADKRLDTPTLVEKDMLKTGVETIESLSQSLGIGGKAAIDEDVNIVDIRGSDEN